MIAALDASQTRPLSVDDEFRLYEITKDFGEISDRASVVPAMFALMERCPDADLGSPGPMVHAIESLGVKAYEEDLAESVRRRPMYLNIWMVNRILNAERDPGRRRMWVDLLRSTLTHPRGADVSELVNDLLRRVASRETQRGQDI